MVIGPPQCTHNTARTASARSIGSFVTLFDWKSALINVKPDTFDRLAQERLPSLLAVEVSRRKTTTAKEHSAIDRRDGDAVGLQLRQRLHRNKQRPPTDSITSLRRRS